MAYGNNAAGVAAAGFGLARSLSSLIFEEEEGLTPGQILNQQHRTAENVAKTFGQQLASQLQKLESDFDTLSDSDLASKYGIPQARLENRFERSRVRRSLHDVMQNQFLSQDQVRGFFNQNPEYEGYFLDIVNNVDIDKGPSVSAEQGEDEEGKGFLDVKIEDDTYIRTFRAYEKLDGSGYYVPANNPLTQILPPRMLGALQISAQSMRAPQGVGAPDALFDLEGEFFESYEQEASAFSESAARLNQAVKLERGEGYVGEEGDIIVQGTPQYLGGTPQSHRNRARSFVATFNNSMNRLNGNVGQSVQNTLDDLYNKLHSFLPNFNPKDAESQTQWVALQREAIRTLQGLQADVASYEVNMKQSIASVDPEAFKYSDTIDQEGALQVVTDAVSRIEDQITTYRDNLINPMVENAQELSRQGPRLALLEAEHAEEKLFADISTAIYKQLENRMLSSNKMFPLLKNIPNFMDAIQAMALLQSDQAIQLLNDGPSNLDRVGFAIKLESAYEAFDLLTGADAQGAVYRTHTNTINSAADSVRSTMNRFLEAQDSGNEREQLEAAAELSLGLMYLRLINEDYGEQYGQAPIGRRMRRLEQSARTVLQGFTGFNEQEFKAAEDRVYTNIKNLRARRGAVIDRFREQIKNDLIPVDEATKQRILNSIDQGRQRIEKDGEDIDERPSNQPSQVDPDMSAADFLENQADVYEQYGNTTMAERYRNQAELLRQKELPQVPTDNNE